MELKDKLQLMRKQNGYSQEQLADKIGIARQTISKWETGQAVPELNGLIQLSNLYGVTIDRMVKENDECNISLGKSTSVDIQKLTEYRKTMAIGTNWRLKWMSIAGNWAWSTPIIFIMKSW